MSFGVTGLFFVLGYGDHQDLHVLTHAFPTRRAPDLLPSKPARVVVPRDGARRSAAVTCTACPGLDPGSSRATSCWCAPGMCASNTSRASGRSEESRVGKECVSTGRSRWSTYQ